METFFSLYFSSNGFNILCKVLYTIFTTVHIQWIKNTSISKRDPNTHPDGTYVFIFFVYGVLPSRSVFVWFIFSSYCSSNGFKLLSKSVYSINETLNWYWPCEISTVFLSQELSWLWPDYCYCRTLSGCLLLALHENHSNSSCKSDMLLYGLHSKT